MTLTLDQLRESGLPTDWMTVKVGYEAFDASWYRWHLPRGEISEYALNLLASVVGTPDEYLIFLLADADPTDRKALNSPLTVLSERSGVLHEIALRKWRYAAVHEFVRTFQPPDDAYDYWDDDEYYTIDLLKSQWNEVIPAHPLPNVAANNNVEDAVLAEITLLRVWLSEEHPKLL